jgi:type I restriction enzyme S subunit
MKDSGVPWLGEIPKHWDLPRLGAVLRERGETNADGRVTDVLSVMRERGVIPYAEKGNVGNKKSDDITRYKIVRPDDIVVNCMNVIIGSVGRSRFTGCLSPVYYVLMRRSGADNPRYIDAYFQTKPFQQSLVRIGNGILAHRMRIPMELLKCEPFPRPPAEEQAAIVRFLDYADRRIRRYIRAKQKLIKLLEEQKQAIIHRAVTRGLDPNVRLKPSGVEWLGDVPEHWEVVLSQRIFKENIRPHNGQPETSLSLSQRDGLIATTEMKERSLQTSTYDNWKLTLPGDIVVNRFKAHLGVFFASTLRGIVSFHYGVFEPRRRMVPKYFEHLYHTVPYRTIYAGRSNGMTVGLQNLSNQNFYNVKSVVPPIMEQAAIVEHLDQATAEIEAAMARARREMSLLREYRTRLIADVVTGKLDVREAAARLPDEPEEPEPFVGAEAPLDGEESQAEDLDAIPEEAEA